MEGKRKYISKSGFKTKNEALKAGMQAYNEYLNGGVTKDSQMSYADYLDYWMKEYCLNPKKQSKTYLFSRRN